MFKKNIKPILMAGALALATAVSPVLADDDIKTISNTNEFNFTKNLSFAEGVTLEAVTFNYTAAFESSTPSTPSTNAPSISITGISFDNKDTDTDLSTAGIQLSKIGKVTITLKKDSNNKLLTIPGEYVYKLTENQLTGTYNGKFTMDQSQYRMRVYVENTANGVAVTNVTITKLTTEVSADGKENVTTEGQKQDSLEFNNSYNKNITKDALKVEKDIVGAQADLTKKFTFDITLTLPSGATGTFNCKDKNGNVVNPISTNNNVITYQVQLANDEYVKWDTLPAGTTYTVIENGDEDRYTPSYAGMEGGESFNSSTDNSITESSDVTVSKIVKDTGENSLKFTNTYQDSPITGVIVNNMPYIALLGASGAGLVVLAASKKRSKK